MIRFEEKKDTSLPEPLEELKKVVKVGHSKNEVENSDSEISEINCLTPKGNEKPYWQ